jgi:Heterokaryon incompatibility protein (HET)
MKRLTKLFHPGSTQNNASPAVTRGPTNIQPSSSLPNLPQKAITGESHAAIPETLTREVSLTVPEQTGGQQTLAVHGLDATRKPEVVQPVNVNRDTIDDAASSTKPLSRFSTEYNGINTDAEASYLLSMSRSQPVSLLSLGDRIKPMLDPSDTLVEDVARRLGDLECLRPPGIPRSSPLANDEVIHIQTCRLCADSFQYALDHGGTVTIISGVPKNNLSYKAISHVWGNKHSRLTMKCQQCEGTTSFSMSSPAKFKRLMEASGAGNKVWLDCLSIDQTNDEDLNSQLSVMGSIYSNAACVLVLLPRQDKEAYDLLSMISTTGKVIVGHHAYFQSNYTRPDYNNFLGDLSKEFWRKLLLFDQKIHTWIYWRRAWTFQEWAVASEIEIAWDGHSRVETVTNIKSRIFLAALQMVQYKLDLGQYAEIDIGFGRDLAVTLFEIIKRLFPYEDLLISPDESDEELLLQNKFPTMGTEQLLGISREGHIDDSARFCARVRSTLRSFGTSKREAYLEADLVCCWAAMCNIKYEYVPDDTFPIALQKVLAELRKRGITVYCWLVNTKGGEGTVDLQFLDYSSPHVQSNARSGRGFVGAPAFTGHADTAFHLHRSLIQAPVSTTLYAEPVALRKVTGGRVITANDMGDTEASVANLGRIISGNNLQAAFGMMFSNVLDSIRQVLTQIPVDQRKDRILVIVSIPIKDAPANEFYAWTTCSRTVELQRAFVVREALNGTLGLAIKNAEMVQLVGYLTLTDQQCGTFLIKTSESGSINHELNIPQSMQTGLNFRGGWQGDRVLRGYIDMEDPKAFGGANHLNDR